MPTQNILYSRKKYIRSLPESRDNEDFHDYIENTNVITDNVFLKSFKNVIVTGHCVIYKSGIIHQPSLAIKSELLYYQLNHFAKSILSEKILLDETKKYLLITDKWSVGHFHWICDVLPKLLILGSITESYVLLLPNHSYIKSNGIACLDRLNIRFRGYYFLNENSFYKVRNLDYLNNITNSGQVDNTCMQLLRDRFVQGRGAHTRKIYVSRYYARFRKVINEPAILPLLKKYDFNVVYPENLDLFEQINLFSSCQIVAGIHGAGLTNCVFMKSEGSVFELKTKEKSIFNGIYWNLADALGHNYFYYNGVCDSISGLMGRGGNLYVQPDEFEEILSQIG